MTSPASPEREQPARERTRDDSTSDNRTDKTPSARSSTIIDNSTIGQRFWVLPSADSKPWTIVEEGDAWALSETLRAGPPVVFAPADLSAKSSQGAAGFARERTQSKLLDRFQEALFQFGTRFVIGLAWMAVGVAGLRIPGEAKVFGDVLLLCGMGFTAYTVLRYGYGVVRWHNRRVDASHAFSNTTAQPHPLATRLAAALELRKKLKSDERGKSPDAELLDSNAYRKLIEEGVTNVKELVTLGRAIENQLGLVGPDGAVRKIADVARDAGLDTETAIFYRDVAAAASEIGLQERAKIDTD